VKNVINSISNERKEEKMFELIRVFLGYCLNCRRACMVGEFKLAGWRHVFNLCDFCLKEQREKLLAQMPSLEELAELRVSDSLKSIES